MDSQLLEFRKLLRKISQRLTPENMKMISYLCKDFMPTGTLSEHHPAMDFLEFCEKEKHYDLEDMGFLAEILYRISRHDLLKLLPDIKNRKAYELHLTSTPIENMNFTPFRISCFKLYDELEDKDFVTLKNLCKDHLNTRNYARSRDVFTLLNCLEEEDLISNEDLDFIVGILKHLDNQTPYKMFLQLAQGNCNFVLPKQSVNVSNFTGNSPAVKVFPISDDDHHQNFRVFNREHSMNVQPVLFDQYHKNEQMYNPNTPVTSCYSPVVQAHKFGHGVMNQNRMFMNDPSLVPSCSEKNNLTNTEQHHSQWRVGGSSSESDQTDPLVDLHEEEHPYNSIRKPQQIPEQQQVVNYMRFDPINQNTMEKTLYETDEPYSRPETPSSPPVKDSMKQHSSATLGSYPIKSNPCGMCLIINNEIFQGRVNYSDATRRLNTDDITPLTREVPSLSLKDRPGSQKDVEDLRRLFQGFGFHVDVRENLEKREMENVLKKYAQDEDHSAYDCFVCFVMSHGLEGTVYGVDGLTLQVSWIHKLFRPGNCSSLTDKPKLFFFQACQGERRMGGHFVPNSDVEHDSPTAELTFTTPNEADFLIGHSTVPGYLSFRSRTEGSWFITSLVNNLEKYHENEDVLSILIKVNRDMSKKPLNQMPMPIATLRKKVFFSRRFQPRQKAL